MDLTLQAEEVILLKDVLTARLEAWRVERAGTDSYTMRQAFKHDVAVLQAILARLEQAGNLATPRA